MFPICLSGALLESDYFVKRGYFLHGSEDADMATKVSDVFEGQLNFAMWKVYRCLYETIATNNGTLYGGCVRDYVDRKRATQAFYEECNKRELTDAEADTCFNNEKVHKESFNSRTRLPNDIDVFIGEKDAEKLEVALKSAGFIIDSHSVPVSYFTRSINEDHKKFLAHRKLRLRFDNRNPIFIMLASYAGKHINFRFTRVKFMIDLIIKKDGCPDTIKPPFNNPDFRCNMLFMSSRLKQVGNYTIEEFPIISTNVDVVRPTLSDEMFSEEKLSVIVGKNPTQDPYQRICVDAIVEDITNNRALLMKGDLDVYRVHKMIGKHYDVDYSYYFATNPVMFSIPKERSKQCIVKIVNPVPFIPQHGLPEKKALCSLCLGVFLDDEKAIRFDCLCSLQCHVECFLKHFKDGVWVCHCCEGRTESCTCDLRRIIATTKKRA